MNLLHYIYIIVCYWERPIWIEIQTSDGISVANKDISAYKNVVLLYFEYLNWIEVIKLACESQLTEILFKLLIIIINLLRLNLQFYLLLEL